MIQVIYILMGVYLWNYKSFLWGQRKPKITIPLCALCLERSGRWFYINGLIPSYFIRARDGYGRSIGGKVQYLKKAWKIAQIWFYCIKLYSIVCIKWLIITIEAWFEGILGSRRDRQCADRVQSLVERAPPWSPPVSAPGLWRLQALSGRHQLAQSRATVRATAGGQNHRASADGPGVGPWRERSKEHPVPEPGSSPFKIVAAQGDPIALSW